MFKRRVNINVHEKSASFWNLGMMLVFGTMPAENCVKLLQQKLEQFGLSLKDDIVAICIDGAAVMTKVGRVIDAEQHFVMLMAYTWQSSMFCTRKLRRNCI